MANACVENGRGAGTPRKLGETEPVMKPMTPHNALERYGLSSSDVPAGDFEKACFLCRIYDKRMRRWAAPQTMLGAVGFSLLVVAGAGITGFWFTGLFALGVGVPVFVSVTDKRVNWQLENIRKTYTDCLVKMSLAALRRKNRDLRGETLISLHEFLFPRNS